MKRARNITNVSAFLLTFGAVVAIFGFASVASGNRTSRPLDRPMPPAPGISPAEAEIVADEVERLSPQGESVPEVGSTIDDDYRLAADRFADCVSTSMANLPEGSLARVEVERSAFTSDRFRIETVFGVVPVDPGGLHLEESIEVQDAVDAVEQSCYREDLASVELAYQGGLLADPAYVQRSSEGLIRCAESVGVTGYSGADDLLAAINDLYPVKQDEVLECVMAYPSVSTTLAPLAGS